MQRSEAGGPTGTVAGTDHRATALAIFVITMDGLAIILLALNLAAGTTVVLDAPTVGGFAIGIAYPLVGWIVAALAERLRRQVDIGSIEGDVRATIEAAVHPAGTGLWVRSAGRSERGQGPR